jgi:hypothetical protein
LTIAAMTLLCLSAQAAPALDDEATAKKTFAALKQRLPKVVEGWFKGLGNDDEGSVLAQVRSVRRLEATQAKVTIVLTKVDSTGKTPPQVQMIIVVFLQYFDGHWTTSRCEPTVGREEGKELRLLMLAIDESDED